jgi:phosphate transport system substrate-binding protein
MTRNIIIIILIAAGLYWGFSDRQKKKNGVEELSGTVAVDGSSTVFPITEAIAEEFGKLHPKVRVTVGISGTGGGFKKFCLGETDINDASRSIKKVEDVKAEEHGIDYIELPVAFDGISVVINPRNTFVDYLTREELKGIWEPGSRVKTWKDVRADWPEREIHLYGPGTDSGTFDYFTKAINGKTQACRSDFTASEDDNVLVQGVAGDPDAMGFFGYAYYAENRDKLKIVPIDNGQGPVAASRVAINNGTYAPLSRPIFIYVSRKASRKPSVKAFVAFYLKQAPEIVAEVGYVALPDALYTLARQRFEKGLVGSVFLKEKSKSSNLQELFTP